MSEQTGDNMKGKRGGFANLTSEQRCEIGRRGGRAAAERGTLHQFTREEMSDGGKAGGAKATPEHLAEIGRQGREAWARRKAERRAEPVPGDT